MKKFSLKVLLAALVVGITGCTTPNTPKPLTQTPITTKASSITSTAVQSDSIANSQIDISKKFQFYKANLSVTQLIDLDTSYHTEKELELLLNEKLRNLLEKENLLSTHINANFLMIDVIYERRFIGDKTPIPTTSLSYPSFEYTIDIKSHSKSLTKIDKSRFSYKGDLALTKRVIGKKLNKKSDEVQFIDALANNIFEDIKNLKY